MISVYINSHEIVFYLVCNVVLYIEQHKLVESNYNWCFLFFFFCYLHCHGSRAKNRFTFWSILFIPLGGNPYWREVEFPYTLMQIRFSSSNEWHYSWYC